MASIIGTNGNDTLNGTPDDDFIDGRGGADIMIGGAGNDVYIVDNVGDQVSEVWGQDQKIQSRVAYTLTGGQDIEVLRADSATGLSLTGNGRENILIGDIGNDTLAGGAGDDRLSGLAGADVMAGGGGDDVYFVDSIDDQVIESAGKGTDIIYSTVSYTLAAGQEIERLRVSGTLGLALTGNELDNILSGGVGDDMLDAGSGNDRINGGGGNDIITTTGQKAIIQAGDGDDSIRVDGSTSSRGKVDGGAGTDTVFSTNSDSSLFETSRSSTRITDLPPARSPRLHRSMRTAPGWPRPTRRFRSPCGGRAAPSTSPPVLAARIPSRSAMAG